MIPDDPKLRRRPATPFEPLESRVLLSAAVETVTPALLVNADAGSGSTVQGYTPARIRDAYNVNQVKFGSISGTGKGQTIAIIDAYNDPNIKGDLSAFDAQFGINDPPSFKVVSQTGSTTSLPTTDAGWAQEISLDVEWAHAIAPDAKILLVEADSASTTDLLAAVDYARSVRGVSTVSMSWGSSEFYGQTGYDGTFTTPAGHRGVTFLAASGDQGSWWGPNWPSSSADVVAVGGTSLRTATSGAYGSERAWSGSGGGVSQYTAEPSYQGTVQSTGNRSTPDVSLNADPNTGYAVYDSLAYQGVSGWTVIGGTSAAAPQWAALIAIGDQGRNLAGRRTLDGATGTLPLLYSLYSNASTYFHDVVSGATSYFVSAYTGYDAATGLGTPKANALAAAIASADAASLAAAAAAQPAASLATTATAFVRPQAVESVAGAAQQVQRAIAATDEAASMPSGGLLLATTTTVSTNVISSARFGAESTETRVRAAIASSSYYPSSSAETGSAAWWLRQAPETSSASVLTQAWVSRHHQPEPDAAPSSDVSQGRAQIAMSTVAGLADAAASFAAGAAAAPAPAPGVGGESRRRALSAVLGFAAVMTGCWAVAVRRQLRAGAAGGSPFHDDAFIDVPPER